MPRLHIQLQNLTLTHTHHLQESYFSLSYEDHQYFSSSFDSESTTLNDDIIIDLKNEKIPEKIELQRWQNHMVIFYHEFDLIELKSRKMAKRRLEVRQGEFIQIIAMIYSDQELQFSPSNIEGISHHYLLIDDINLPQKKTIREDKKRLPSYFTITTSGCRKVLPIKNSTLAIKLPDWIEIGCYRQNQFQGKSKKLEAKDLKEGKMSIEIGGVKGNLQMRWAVNLHQCQVEKGLLLLDSQELLLYDFEIKVENPGEMTGAKLSIIYNNKSFEFTDELNTGKLIRLKRIIFAIVKSQIEDLDIIIERSNKTIAHVRFNTGQLKAHTLGSFRKKLVDANNGHKMFATLRFKGQKAKNVSIPQSNRYWRQSIKRKANTKNTVVALEQLSIYYSEDEPLQFTMKCQNEEKHINNICNLTYYSQQGQIIHPVIEMTLKNQEGIYLIVKKQNDKKDRDDFLGIAVISPSDLKLGLNPYEIALFKNQQRSATINCLINKMYFSPFIKSFIRAEPFHYQPSSLTLDVFLVKLELTPYYHTYKYDNKNELYCILEINKVKKVLILEHDIEELTFYSVSGSDALDFVVQNHDYQKVKFTLLVSDLGHQEQIYGTAISKIKIDSVESDKPHRIRDIKINNQFGLDVGNIIVEVSKTIPFSKPNKSPRTSPKNAKELSQISFDTHGSRRAPNRRYSGGNVSKNSNIIKVHDFGKKTKETQKVKAKQASRSVHLPVIKEKKTNDNFKDLHAIMKVRKRGHGGNYELNSTQNQDKKQRQQSFDMGSLERSNPNLERNLQILFPLKPSDKRIKKPPKSPSERINYQSKLHGLKSVMQQIEDLGEVEPTIKQSKEDYQERVNSVIKMDFEEPEWQGNQFV